MKHQSTIKAVALGGVFTAFAVVLMLLSSFMPLSYFWVMVAGLVMAVLVMELGQKYAVCAFLATSVLSFLLVPNLLMSIEFVALYGLYPSVLLPLILKVESKKWRFFLKLLVFAFNGWALFYLGTFITGLNVVSQQLLERGELFLFVPIGVTVLGNFAYDYFLSTSMKWYKQDLRRRIFNKI